MNCLWAINQAGVGGESGTVGADTSAIIRINLRKAHQML